MSDDRGTPEPYRPPGVPGGEPEPTAPVRVPPPPAGPPERAAPPRPQPERPEPQRPSPAAEPAGTPPQPAAPPAAQPPAAAHRPPTDLDDFLARAVDRQIAEQRSLREALQELTNAVRELQARPAVSSSGPGIDLAELEARVGRAVATASPGFDPKEMEARLTRAVAAARPPIDPAELEARIARALSSASGSAAVDPAEIEARISRAVASSTEVLVGEFRDLRSTVVPGLQRATEASSGSRAIEHDMAILRDAIGGLSADVEGIAQALIDLNGGLRDWADGIDANIEAVKAAVKETRDTAARVEELQADASELRARRGDSLPLLPVEGELTDERRAPGVSLAPRDITTEIEQRVKETIELSLYLADQIESFDKAIANIGDLPSRLEGVVSQALKRMLAARAKLDRDAELTLDEAVATLDEHVGAIADLGSIAEMQARLEAGLDAIADAIDRSADGDLPHAGTALKKASTRAPKPAPKKRTSVRKSAKAKAKTKTEAKRSRAKSTSRASKGSKPAAKRTQARRRKPPEADYLSLDADELAVPSRDRAAHIPDGD